MRTSPDSRQEVALITRGLPHPSPMRSEQNADGAAGRPHGQSEKLTKRRKETNLSLSFWLSYKATAAFTEQRGKRPLHQGVHGVQPFVSFLTFEKLTEAGHGGMRLIS